MSLGPYREDASDRDVPRPQRFTLGGDELASLLHLGVEQAAARAGPEGAHRKEQRHPEGPDAAGEEPDDQAPAADGLLALLQGAGEGGDLLGLRADPSSLIGGLLVRQEPLGPHDQPDADAEERHGEERALQLGLAAERVHHGEAQAGEDAEREGDDDDGVGPP